jgi:Protein of unknown function (DUF2911)
MACAGLPAGSAQLGERKMKTRSMAVSLVLLLFASLAVAQQDKSARPSPPAKASCSMGDGATITVDYSSPKVKGRKIFGGLVPYGQEWRLGANEATTFVTTANVTVGGTKVPAGSYTLFAVPEADKWTLVISKKTGEWGVPYPGKDSDFARVDMKAAKLPSNAENFAIAFDKTGAGCTMQVEWETARATVDISK